MNIAEQFHFDFQKAEAERALMEQWEANEKAQADQWTTESLAMHWSGIHHKDHWESLPRYERARIVDLYEYEQQQLAFAIERWEPDYEVFYPDGSHTFVPCRPFRIPEFNRVNRMPSQQEIDEFNARAKAMADQLSADWSARRPPSVVTYDPFLAGAVSLILGRKIEAVYPPHEVADLVPVVWKMFTGRGRQAE